LIQTPTLKPNSRACVTATAQTHIQQHPEQLLSFLQRMARIQQQQQQHEQQQEEQEAAGSMTVSDGWRSLRTFRCQVLVSLQLHQQQQSQQQQQQQEQKQQEKQHTCSWPVLLEALQYQMVSQLFGNTQSQALHSAAQHAGSAIATLSSSDISSSSSEDDSGLGTVTDTSDGDADSSSGSSGRIPVETLQQLLSHKKLPNVVCSFKVRVQPHVTKACVQEAGL
jgi:hypothetical protein